MKAACVFVCLGLVAGLGACRQSTLPQGTTAAAPNRLPLTAVVTVFRDETPETPKSRMDVPPGPRVFQVNLTRGDSPWRPRLSMDFLSGAVADELKARLTQEASVVQSPSDAGLIFEEKLEGRLFVTAKVKEAAWTRSPLGGEGTYRLKAEFAAALEPKHGPSWTGWNKTVEVEEPRRGKPEAELARLAGKAAAEAVEDLGRSLEKVLAIQAAAQEGQ